MKNKNNNEITTIAYSTYRCQYHIVFAPKFRRQEIYGMLQSLADRSHRPHHHPSQHTEAEIKLIRGYASA